MDISAIALQGLQQAGERLDQAAARIASAGALSDQADVNAVDLSGQLVALLSAQNQYDFNVQTMKTAEQVQKAILDVHG